MADKTVVVRIVVRANQFSSGLKGAAAQTGQFAVDVERASARAGSSALALGAASATAGKLLLVGIGGALAVSAKAAIDYESALAGVAKTTGLAGSAFATAGSPLAAFGDALRALSLRIPVNVNDLAAIAEVGGQLGIQVPNLIEFTEVMAAMGVATNLGAEEAATGFARFANIMGTNQDQFGRLGSVVVDLGNKLAATESEILHFGLRLSPIGKTVGMTEEEVLGLSAAMANLGIPAERGGTALQRVFLDMNEAVLTGGESLAKFAAATRMTTDEFVALFQESPADAFVELIKQIDATQEAGGNASGTLRDLGIIQQRSIQVMLAASNGWETVAESIDIANEAGAEGNALFEEAARRYGTTASQIQILSNTFNDLRIEIGNALLGSGGLAAGIDFLREFFRIIKDNLPMLGNLAKVLATIATLRIGASLVSGLAAGLTTVKSMKVGIDGVTASTRALRIASLGLNTAVFAAIAIVGGLITAWGAAAAKAAELRQAARDLQEQLDQGVDPVEAWITVLREQGVLTDDLQALLNDSGISVEQFVRRIMEGDEAFQAIGEAARTGQGDIETWAEILGISVEEAIKLHPTFEQVKGDMNAFGDAVNDSSEILDGFFEERSNNVANGLIEAGFGARFTTEEIRAMADEAVRLANIKTSPADIIKSFTEGTPGRRRVEGGQGHNRAPTPDIVFSWEEMVMAMEGGEDKIDGFYESIAEKSEEFSTTLRESFDEVRDSIVSGFPTWDEYEQKSIESLAKVLEAQDLYLEDLKDGFELQSAIAGTVSDQTLAFIEGLDPATKGALGRLRETNREGFNDWLAAVEENLGEQESLVADYWGLKLPGHVNAGFATMVGNLLTQVQTLGLVGEDAGGAFEAGLMAIMESLPADQQDDFQTYMEELLGQQSFLSELGFKVGDDVVLGFLRALDSLGYLAGISIREAAIDIGATFDDAFGIKSPSKMTYRVGQFLTRGLFVGMEDEMDRQLAITHNPMVNVMRPESKPVFQAKVQSGSRDINIYYPEHKSDDIIDGVKKSAILSSLQREAEVAIGPG